MLKTLKSAILVFISLTLLTGVVYPLAVTGIAQVFFKRQAEGSLISRGGMLVGSSLIGQQFDDPKYIWGRPSATSPAAYNAASSSGSNLGPSNPVLRTAVERRIAAYRSADPGISIRSRSIWSPRLPADSIRISVWQEHSIRRPASPASGDYPGKP